MKFIFTLLIVISSVCAAQRYVPSDKESRVHFTIRNFGIKTGGDLTNLSGEIFFFRTDMNATRMNVSVEASTIDTDNNTRDSHLKDEEYFDVANHPLITLSSTKIEQTNKTDDGYYYFTGNLTMRGITKEITFPFKVEKTNDDYLFTGEFEINRLDFEIGSNSAVLSNTVNVSLSVLAKKA